MQPARNPAADRTSRTLRLEIGGLHLAVATAESDLDLSTDGALARFVVEGGVPDALVTAGVRDTLEVPDGKPLFDGGELWRLFRQGERLRFVFASPVLGPRPYRDALFEPDFSSGEVWLRRSHLGVYPGVSPLEYPLDELIVQGLLARGRGVEVHACGVVEPSGRGLLFVGQSEAGKTTMARLWQAEPGARILSDDRIIVRRYQGRLVMYGTPWHGEAGLSEPASAPLAAVLFLAHGAADELVPLGASAAAARLVACSFPPFYDRDGIDFTVGFLGGVASDVPCRELRFVPSPRVIEAVRSWAASP